jgi:hypothetical protein
MVMNAKGAKLLEWRDSSVSLAIKFMNVNMSKFSK